MIRTLARPIVAMVLVLLASGVLYGAGSARADSIDPSSLLFDGHNTFFRSPFGADKVNSPVTLRFQTAHSGATAVTLVYWNSSAASPTTKSTPLARDAADSNAQRDVWQVTIRPNAVGFWSYYFSVQNGAAQTYYANARPYGYGAAGAAVSSTPSGYNLYELTVYDSGFSTPAWLKNAVMYQIFPDRFYDGNTANDALPNFMNAYGFTPKFYSWNTPEPTTSSSSNDYNQLDYYGGDLQGIIDKLPYLKGLGVNVLYLNPIFMSGTNHGYDTANYMQIAPHFGTLATFRALIKAAHGDGMKVILDGVFNHTSSDSCYFNKYGHFSSTCAYNSQGGNTNTGAYNNQSSPYYSWYTFSQWPNSYSSYFGINTLPQLNESNSVKNFIFNGAGSVAQYWLKQGADGWRLDHAVGKSDAYWQQFRTSLKANFPNDALICECENGSTWGGTEKLLGKLFDGGMNYPFRDDVLNFFAGGREQHGMPFSATVFLNAVTELAAETPLPALYGSMNVIGTHDTDRALDLANGSVATMEQFAAFQMTWLGTPEIYYGDEAGVTGSGSPDTNKRKPFPWSSPNTTLQGFYTKIIHLRNKNSALRDGSITPLLSDDTHRVVAFMRKDAAQSVLVVINDGSSAQDVGIPTTGLNQGAHLKDGISGAMYTVSGSTLTVHIPATSTAVLTP